MSLGMLWAGIDVVGGVEFNRHAVNTYEHNIGSHIVCRDICEFSPQMMETHLMESGKIASIDDIGIIFGGPPCPGFSLIGRSKISHLIKSGAWEGSDSRHRFIDDPRNELFREFLKYVEHFSPDVFAMENVKGMKSYEKQQHGTIVDIIKQEFVKFGYNVTVKVINSSDYGVPQVRQRLIFLGSKIGTDLTHPTGFTWKTTVSDALADLPKVDPLTGKSLEEKLLPMKDIRGNSQKKNLLRYLRTQAVSGRKKSNKKSLDFHYTRKVNPRDQAIFPLLTSGENGARILYKDVYPDMLKIVKKNLPTGYAMASKKKGYEVYSKSDAKRRWKWYDSSKFGDKMRRIKSNKPSPTIVAHLAKDGYMFVHPFEHRTITVREAARLQSFPDSFDFSAGGKNAFSHQMRQIGNAVPPLMALALGQSIIEHLRGEPILSLEEVFR